jgi:hypothetical protein
VPARLWAVRATGKTSRHSVDFPVRESHRFTKQIHKLLE